MILLRPISPFYAFRELRFPLAERNQQVLFPGRNWRLSVCPLIYDLVSACIQRAVALHPFEVASISVYPWSLIVFKRAS